MDASVRSTVHCEAAVTSAAAVELGARSSTAASPAKHQAYAFAREETRASEEEEREEEEGEGEEEASALQRRVPDMARTNESIAPS